MKKTLKISFFLVLAIFVGSCNKEEPQKAVEEVKETITTPVPENVVSFRITPVDGRPGGNGNYQAGETIKFQIKVTDAQDTGASYKITPEGMNQQKHQIIGTDYKLNRITQGINISETSLTVDSSDKSNYEFSITILRPGTFTLKFIMQKKNNAMQNVGLPVSENLAFAAVAFSAYSEFGYLNISGHRNCYGTVEGRRYDRNFYFSVNCGDQATDKYLFDPNFTYSYESSYCAGSGGASGGLSNGDKNKFCRSYAAGAGDCSIGRLEIINCNGHNGFIIDEIKIFIKPINGNVFNTISYKNVPITAEYDVL